MGWINDRLHAVTDLGSTTWLGLALWAMVVVAVAALIYVRYHLSRVRKLSFEDNRPQVTMFMEPHAADWHLIELVVRNFGQRTAYDVRFGFNNPPTVAEYENAYEGMVDITELRLPEELPELAPGQEWRTVWDSALDRHQLGGAIASRFAGTVTYYDSPAPAGRWRALQKRRRKPIETKFVLDWGSLPPVQRIELMTTHDLARREKQKLELLRWVLTYFQVASQETRPEDVRAEIDRIKQATQEIRDRVRSRQLEGPPDVRMRPANSGSPSVRETEPEPLAEPRRRRGAHA
ncbi:hypothetical protein [Mycobacterium shimoidei]|uniref:hypothetical protein n=1 Tax=Mycobacterium shimoidei TaxID=29313 RepID=UPI000848AFA3|nr:hypothetical protein [Mycobacterium shimoidei]ODR15283.1 hypothetical protein BHQ16_00590 [Mycobacterium shimoidei]